MKLTANRAIRGYRVARGGTFDAKDKDARTLLALGYATKAAPVAAPVTPLPFRAPSHKVTEASDEPPVLEVEPRPRRRYRRRDMVASD
jgi:hypothetical protein